MWGIQRSAEDTEPLTGVPRGTLTVQQIVDRIAAEDEEAGRPSPVLDHAAPRGAIGVDYARTLMRRHRSCSRESCPAKRAAFAVLVDHGIIRPRPMNGRLEVGRA